jgi:hypothetical protein|tara:strand:+ start:138 stop:413 length:276 start_codon:yes stop_codon:yes gene_type:complete
MSDSNPSLATPGRWLRNKKDGTIYGYTDVMASNPGVEEVPDELAFPEKHIPEKQKGRKAKVDLSTSDEVVAKATPSKSTGMKINATGGNKK